MKLMKNFLSAVVRIWHLPFVKYGVISIIGVILVGAVGDNSLLAHIRNKQYIGELADEINKYNEQAKADMRKIRELNRNPKAMERIARERYFMKHDDEDIFVLSDDDRSPQFIASDDETTE